MYATCDNRHIALFWHFYFIFRLNFVLSCQAIVANNCQKIYFETSKQFYKINVENLTVLLYRCFWKWDEKNLLNRIITSKSTICQNQRVFCLRVFNTVVQKREQLLKTLNGGKFYQPTVIYQTKSKLDNGKYDKPHKKRTEHEKSTGCKLYYTISKKWYDIEISYGFVHKFLFLNICTFRAHFRRM